MFPDGFDKLEDLLVGGKIEFQLIDSVTFSKCSHFYNLVHCDSVFILKWFNETLDTNAAATLTLLYYAGYLTITVCYINPVVLFILISSKADNQFQIPNQKVMSDWARWFFGDVGLRTIFSISQNMHKRPS